MAATSRNEQTILNRTMKNKEYMKVETLKRLLCIGFVSLFTFHFSPIHSQETLVDGVAAVVGRNIIKHSDIERPLAQMRVRGGVTDVQASRCAILENLILNQLLIHKGEVDSVEVTDDEVDYYVDYYMKNDLRQYGTREALREATGFTYDELKEQYQRMIRNMMLAQRVQYTLTRSILSPVSPGQSSSEQWIAEAPAPTLAATIDFMLVAMITEASRWCQAIEIPCREINLLIKTPRARSFLLAISFAIVNLTSAAAAASAALAQAE